MLKPRTRECPLCRRAFLSIDGRKTCSAECLSVVRSKNAAAGNPKKTRVCVVCGKTFVLEKDQHKRKTCSAACRSELARRLDNADPDAIARGHKTSPVCQPDEKNCRAKDWTVRAPNGIFYRFRNLSLFVRQHRELFSEEELKSNPPHRTLAESGLSSISPDRTLRRKSWHGWTWSDE